MLLRQYRQVWQIPTVRDVTLVGLAVRAPIFAAAVALTLHVVLTLDLGYGQAGLVSAVFTIGIAISAPWRGRLLDTVGLRRTVLPSVIVQVGVWSVAPFVSFSVLLPLVALSGLFVVPVFTVIRQALVHVVPEDQRRAALSVDSVSTEISFMIGPVLGVWAATTWDTRWVLVGLQAIALSGALWLMVLDPPLRADPSVAEPAVAEPRDVDAAGSGPAPSSGRVGRWLTRPALGVYVAAFAATVVLGCTDVGIVAVVRAHDAAATIGVLLAVWGAGSVLGGLAYGAWHRPIPLAVLLAGLSLTTAPVALAGNLPALGALLFGCGVFCAPTITATIDTLGRLVPEAARGLALGWHGSAMTAGQALGAPLAGFAIDHAGWQSGFLIAAALGLLATGVVLLLARPRQARIRDVPTRLRRV